MPSLSLHPVRCDKELPVRPNVSGVDGRLARQCHASGRGMTVSRQPEWRGSIAPPPLVRHCQPSTPKIAGLPSESLSRWPGWRNRLLAPSSPARQPCGANGSGTTTICTVLHDGCRTSKSSAIGLETSLFPFLPHFLRQKCN